MNKDYIIEDGILLAYLGTDPVAKVPEGVKQIGGVKPHDENRSELLGDPIGYKAFYDNKLVTEVILPEGVTTIGFKSFEHCENLRKLTIPKSLKSVECNAMLGLNLDEVTYLGSIDNFLDIDLHYWCDDCKVVHCIDGDINFKEEFFISEFSFSGTKQEWESGSYKGHEWLKKRIKTVHCTDGDIVK